MKERSIKEAADAVKKSIERLDEITISKTIQVQHAILEKNFDVLVTKLEETIPSDIIDEERMNILKRCHDSLRKS